MMDDYPTDDHAAIDEFAEVVDEPAAGIDGIKRRVVRIGWVVCLFGLVVTIMGTAQVARKGGSFDSAEAQAVHAVGLMIMLGGFLTALLGYRVPWLADAWRAFRYPSRREDAASAASSPTTRIPGPLIILCAAGAFGVFSLFVYGLLPFALSGLYFVTMTFLLFAGTIVVMASGTTWQRAFCVGASVPLTLCVLHLWFVTLFARGPIFARGWQTGAGFWELMQGQWQWIAETLGAIGAGMGGIIFLAWAMALLLGSVTLTIRVALLHWNHESSR